MSSKKRNEAQNIEVSIKALLRFLSPSFRRVGLSRKPEKNERREEVYLGPDAR